MAKTPRREAKRPTEPPQAKRTTEKTASTPPPEKIATGKSSTATTPDYLKGGTLLGPNVTIALLIYGTDKVHLLPRSVSSIVVGSTRTAGIVIASDEVSRQHCRLERRDSRREALFVIDLDSKNGTFFLGERQVRFSVRPGQVFALGSQKHRLLTLNAQMLAHLPELQDILGTLIEHDSAPAPSRRDVPGSSIEPELGDTPQTPSPSELIVLAVGDGSADVPGSLLVVAQPHCQQLRLAQIIHEISRLRERPVVVRTAAELPRERKAQLEFVRTTAWRSTLILELGDYATQIDPNFVALLARSQVRTIVLAGSREVAAESLGEPYEESLEKIRLRPLAERPLAIDRLLDHALEEQNSPLRMARFTAENQEALRAHRWPDNWKSLAQAAKRLTAIHRHGGIYPAAQALNVSPTTLTTWYGTTLKLTEPLCRIANRR